MTSWRLVISMLAACVLYCASTAHGQDREVVSDDLREEAVGTLRETLATQEKWVKVHAAEFLLALHYTEGVREAFEEERQAHGEEAQYRIGIWRVLARAAPSDDARAPWIDNIRAAYMDTDGPDRLHATETLAKLDYVATEAEREQLSRDAQSEDGPIAAFASCVLVHSGALEYERQLAALLNSSDERTRLCAAYAIRHIETISPETLATLGARVQEEPDDSSARPYLLSASFIHNDTIPAEYKKSLRSYAESGDTASKAEAIAALAIKGDDTDIALLETLLADPEADVRANAAYALLRIARRALHPLQALDWLAIAVYAIAMLGVGWYYARRTSTSEDYLLGGRRMNPLTVGLSMFATLLSTLTYLALPGEMAKHGPMIISQYLAFPLIFLVIGFVLIPAILRQRVDSAYEILEIKLGRSVRMLGSVFFLMLRFMWMALIIYATSSKVLVPVLQLDVSMTPVVCIIMGVITIAYTSMGGLRAVVMTDVMQSVILFGGAILTISIITIEMGGVTQWFPDSWPANWQPLKIAYDPTARVTVAGAMTSAFVWYCCTAGSDQVAIQRYLATKDAQAARKVVMTSMSADVTVGVFLGTLGVALWSYFLDNPHMLPDNFHSLQNADTLFPRFISLVLPTGIGGLVIAGLLAAAMSSLSSGVNSSSLVITVDFMKRSTEDHVKSHEKRNIRAARWVSVFVGAAVISLSILAGLVGGNLLEVVYKVVNLLVAPLFVLFFMALFVKWATAPGAIVAGLSSAAMAVAVAYGGFLGLSFIWIMPMALVTGIVVGPIVSLLPIGRKPQVT